MSWRTHLLVLAGLALGALAGLLLWNRWGANVLLADAIAWCS